MQPTTEFGELYQYSNLLAAAAGFIGGHVAYPKLELGKAYDKTMRSRVFGPLGMKATTFDPNKAQRGNWARPHEPDIDGKMALAGNWMSAAIVPLRQVVGEEIILILLLEISRRVAAESGLRAAVSEFLSKAAQWVR